MITLKIETQQGQVSEEAAIFVAVIKTLEELKIEGIVKDYSDIQVNINSNGGQLHGKAQ